MRSLFAVRTIVSFLAGVFVVFNQGHYVAVSLIALAGFGIALGLTQIALAFIGRGGLSAIESVPSSIISLTTGLLAALATVQAAQSGASAHQMIQEFSWLVTGWALTSGAFELYLARRAGFGTPIGRDWAILSGLSLLLGLVNLAIPMDRTTTVGMFVAYMMFSAVHLGIAATSPATIDSESTAK